MTASTGQVYRPTGDERARIEASFRRSEPVLLAGPTGVGKTTLVTEIAAALGRPLRTVVGHADISPNDLLGRWLLGPDGSAWKDGPLTHAVQQGEIFYFDEIGGVPEEVLKVLYPLLDHRRRLVIPALAAEIEAAPQFQFVGAYNPGYGAAGRGFTPAFRQRCRFVRFAHLSAAAEADLLAEACGATPSDAEFLVAAAQITRRRFEGLYIEGASTRVLLLAAAALADGGDRDAVLEESVLAPLTDDPTALDMLREALRAAGLLSIGPVGAMRAEGAHDEAPEVDDADLGVEA